MPIRDAAPRDYAAVRAVLRHAFPADEEADLVEALRADGDVIVELVEANDDALRGHILYSPLAIERGSVTLKAAALAPVAVLPAFQGQGIGNELIRAGNARCAALGLEAIVVVGHADYYPRFGFSAPTAESLQAPFSGPHFMALELKPGALKDGGKVRYAKAFGV
ncbi:MAG TPA: N-acetyltransferase [Candidatus Binatia bacterium]|nr:N-acetyltransferase [Candidatus Binatia bacterium]